MQTIGPLAQHFPGTKPERVDYLGAIVSTKGSQNQATWSDIRPKYRVRMDAISAALSRISKQCAFLLLRYVNITVSYVFSNTRPELTVTLRKEHTIFVRHALNKLLGAELTDSQWQHASLDDSQGGLGLPDWSLVAEDSHKALKALVTVPPFVASPSTISQSIFDVVKSAQLKVAEQLIDAKVPHYSNRTKEVLSDQGHLRLRWHFIRPVDKALRLLDEQWQRGVQLLLKVNEVDAPNCGRVPADTAMEHAMTCHSCAGGLWYMRHQRVLFGMQHVLRQAGIHCAPVDWRRLGLRKDITPDGLIFTQHKTLSIDVTVRHQRPHSTNNILDQAYHEKIEKYKELCDRVQWLNTPLVFSAYGNPESRTVKSLRYMVCVTTTRTSRTNHRASTQDNLSIMVV